MTFLSDLISLMTKIRLSWVIKAGIFQLLFVTIANIVLSEFFYFILDVTGQYHLDKDNVVTFLKNPIALALLGAYLFLLAAFIHLEFLLYIELLRIKKLVSIFLENSFLIT